MIILKWGERILPLKWGGKTIDYDLECGPSHKSIEILQVLKSELKYVICY